jgi:hypothetical protein
VAIDGGVGDVIDTQLSGAKRRHRDGRRDQRVDLLKQLQERRAQSVASKVRFHVFDAAIVAAAGNNVTVVVIGGGERFAVPAGDSGGLFGVGDRFQDAIEHIRGKYDAVGDKVSAQPGQRLGGR